jgi:hypothetical protein
MAESRMAQEPTGEELITEIKNAAGVVLAMTEAETGLKFSSKAI